MTTTKPVPGTGGDHYIPYSERSGAESVVYFTRDLSAEGLLKIFKRISANLTGKTAIKLHTGEKNGPNILPREMVKAFQAHVPNSNIVETNTLYIHDRDTTAKHRETLKVNGWDFCPVDIMDEEGNVLLPVRGGKHFKEMSMGGATGASGTTNS